MTQKSSVASATADSSSTVASAMRCDSSRPATPSHLEFPTPTLVDEATYAVEAATLGEADVVRLQRRLDTLEERLATIELRLPNRVYRRLVGPVKRVGQTRLTARRPTTTS